MSMICSLVLLFLAHAAIAEEQPWMMERINDIVYMNRTKDDFRMADADERLRWQDATIPYVIAPMDFDDQEIKEMKESFRDYEKETCIKFRPIRDSDKSYIVVRRGAGGCNAILGQSSRHYAQSVNLGDGCRFYGLFRHEFGHTVGLHHEHQHPDRNTGVTINFNNVDDSMKQWFEPIERNKLNMYGVPYDIQSVMHYGEYAFVKYVNGKQVGKTIVARDPAQQRFLFYVYMKDFSFGDIMRVNLMYKCNAHCRNVSCPGGFVNKNCQCETKQNFAKRRCYNIYSDSECEKRRNECHKDVYSMYELYVNCRKTCDRCYVPI